MITLNNRHINITIGVAITSLICIIGGVRKAASSFNEIKNDIMIVKSNTEKINNNIVPLTELTLNIGSTVILLADRHQIPAPWALGNVFKN